MGGLGCTLALSVGAELTVGSFIAADLLGVIESNDGTPLGINDGQSLGYDDCEGYLLG